MKLGQHRAKCHSSSPSSEKGNEKNRADPSGDFAAEWQARGSEMQGERRQQLRKSPNPKVVAQCQSRAERARQYIETTVADHME